MKSYNRRTKRQIEKRKNVDNCGICWSQKEKFYEDATKKGEDQNCDQARGSAPWSHTCRRAAAVPSSGPGGEVSWAGTAGRDPGRAHSVRGAYSRCSHHLLSPAKSLRLRE